MLKNKILKFIFSFCFMLVAILIIQVFDLKSAHAAINPNKCPGWTYRFSSWNGANLQIEDSNDIESHTSANNGYSQSIMANMGIYPDDTISTYLGLRADVKALSGTSGTAGLEWLYFDRLTQDNKYGFPWSLGDAYHYFNSNENYIISSSGGLFVARQPGASQLEYMERVVVGYRLFFQDGFGFDPASGTLTNPCYSDTVFIQPLQIKINQLDSGYNADTSPYFHMSSSIPDVNEQFWTSNPTVVSLHWTQSGVKHDYYVPTHYASGGKMTIPLDAISLIPAGVSADVWFQVKATINNAVYGYGGFYINEKAIEGGANNNITAYINANPNNLSAAGNTTLSYGLGEFTLGKAYCNKSSNPASTFSGYQDSTNGFPKQSVDISQTTTFTVDCYEFAGGRHATASVTVPVATPDTAPLVLTSPATSISQTTAKLNGNVTSGGSSVILKRGFYLSNASNCSNGTENIVSTGNIAGPMSKDIGGLVANTTYYFIAYAQNANTTNNWGFGLCLPFKTTKVSQLLPPSVMTDSASQVTQTTATLNGNVTSQGSSALIKRGFYLSNANDCSNGTEYPATSAVVGAMSQPISGLIQGRNYHFIAYAQNSVGWSFGYCLNFSTIANLASPTVETNPETNVTENSVTLNGNVINSGSSSLLYRGFYFGGNADCYSNYPILDVPQASLGSFLKNVTGLNTGLTYYFMAYAQNSNDINSGTARGYGKCLEFKPSIAGPVDLTSRKVKIVVSWTESGLPRSIELLTFLQNIDQ